jgi:hypothetical protein
VSRSLSVPYRPGTPAYKLQAKIRRSACIHALPRVPRLRTPPPCSGGLRCYHVSHGSGPRLPAREDSGTATCRTATDPSRCSGGLRCCHLSHGSGPRLPAGGWVAPGLSHVPLPLEGRGLRIKKDLAARACSNAHVFQDTCVRY